MLRALQIWHVILIAAVPVLLALLRVNSEPHDSVRTQLEGGTLLLAGVWLGYILVYAVVVGKKDEAQLSALALYRRLLADRRFLWLLNVLGTSIVIVLARENVWVRQVEFVSPVSATINVANIAGQENRVGYLRAEVPLRIRLPVGYQKIVYRHLATGKPISAAEVHVPSIFESREPVREIVAVTKEERGDKLR